MEHPAEFMRRELRPRTPPRLSNEDEACPVFYNVVSSTKMDPLSDLRNRTDRIDLMKMLTAYPNAEIKSGFGALIVRYMHSLAPEQELAPWLKPPAVTHLVFAGGALGSTGDASEEQARLSTHELRMGLYYTLGVRTNFHRFAVSNMVGSSTLGYNVDLARLHADNPRRSNYYPSLFPGLFWSYKHVFKDRDRIHDALLSMPRRRVELMEDDLIHLHRTENFGARDDSDDQIREQIRGMLDEYLPRVKHVIVLVFVGGGVVGLGLHNLAAAIEAFQDVNAVARNYRIDDDAVADAMRKRRASVRLDDKNQRMEETHNSYVAPFSQRAQRKLLEIAESVEDEEERKQRIKEVVQKELDKKRKKKNKKHKLDDGDAELEQFIVALEQLVVARRRG